MMFQQCLFQSGLIHSKAMPQLVLSRAEHGVTMKYADASVDGCPVVMAKRYRLTLLLILWPSIYGSFHLTAY